MYKYKGFIKLFSLVIAMFFSTIVNSAVLEFEVDAITHNSRTNTGLDTGLNFNISDSIIGSVNQSDLWSAGEIPRWSNANGLVGDLFATGTDESGEAVGTKIGEDKGDLTQDGFTAPFGALVGAINNVYFFLGTDFNLAAPAAGVLTLYYWDENRFDNEDFVTVFIEDNVLVAGEPGASAIPIPAAVWLFGSGFIALLGMRKKS